MIENPHNPTTTDPRMPGDDAQYIESALRQMHMPGMLSEYQQQRNNLQEYGKRMFDDRFGDICTAEMDRRNNCGLKNRLDKAHLFIANATIATVEDIPMRQLNMEQVYRLCRAYLRIRSRFNCLSRRLHLSAGFLGS